MRQNFYLQDVKTQLQDATIVSYSCLISYLEFRWSQVKLCRHWSSYFFKFLPQWTDRGGKVKGRQNRDVGEGVGEVIEHLESGTKSVVYVPMKPSFKLCQCQTLNSKFQISTNIAKGLPVSQSVRFTEYRI